MYNVMIMLLLLISFIAGVLTILAPCVLPVLPVVIGGSIGGDTRQKARPYVIGLSLMFSIIFFTLLLKVSTILIDVPPQALNWLSGILLIGLGITAIFPQLWEKLMIRLNWEAASQRFLSNSQHNKGIYTGAILIGIALGPVFASCSPTYAFILATILPKSFLAGLIYLVVYTIGLALALLVVSLAGRKFIKRWGWAVDTHSLFRRLLGVLFVLIGIAVITGFEITAETWLANRLPFDETKIEQVLLSSQHNQIAASQAPAAGSVLNVKSTPAPELAGLTNWINSPALTLAQLKGKVVLVDFWTYSCINCIRTIPYIQSWYQTYAKDGFVVLGINTPEFAFEHNPDNVAAAVKTDGITYPVALDNNYGTWNAYQNDSWPADYLIDKQGNVRYISLGEGEYDTTEKAIQELLGINQPLQTTNFNVPIGDNQTPETYFGTNRTQNYIGTPDLTGETGATTTFTPASLLAQNEWTLSGDWEIDGESITSKGNNATLTFKTYAKDVYVVAAPSGAAGTMNVGLPSSDSDSYGSDAPAGSAVIDQSKLYHIVSLPSAKASTVTLKVPSGITLYTFTFGS
jgi:cytochrome c biogenesis protein CcdA/thiol-disulfide isomerase/thioredoxin